MKLVGMKDERGMGQPIINIWVLLLMGVQFLLFVVEFSIEKLFIICEIRMAANSSYNI